MTAELATVGGRDGQFSVRPGRGDEFAHGGSSGDSRTRERDGFRQRDIYVPDLHIDTLKIKGRNFH